MRARRILPPFALALVLLSALAAHAQRAPDAGAAPPNDGAATAASAQPAPADTASTDDEGDGGAADDDAAAHALGNESDDAPDPTSAEPPHPGGTAEGEPLPGRSRVGDEIAALSDRACYRALRRAHVPFEPLRHRLAGVATPVRITGEIAGVRYRASDRQDVHELMDCRLAVALVRFSHLLRALGVVEVRHYSTYRAPSAEAVAEQPIQTRHAGGLAIDAAWFRLENGQTWVVDRDFHGTLGEPVCGPEARVLDLPGARILRTIACDSARRGLFHVILTPNHNAPHHNHFHLEVTRGVSWQYVH